MVVFAFNPWIDLPLVIVALAVFGIHFSRWANRKTSEPGIDLRPRLPGALIRLVAIFAGLVVVCWFVNLAIWALIAILLVIALIVVIGTGEDFAPDIIFALTAGLIRECCFGFPQLILEPPTTGRELAQTSADHPLVGKTGKATSPLRPSGDVEIDGREHSAISESGTMIDVGSEVIVTTVRNGRICVRTARH